MKRFKTDSVAFNLMTRREIMEVWRGQSDDMLDSYCCRGCRDILQKDCGGIYRCTNLLCKWFDVPIKED